MCWTTSIRLHSKILLCSCICKFRCFILKRISTRQEMKERKDGGGLRKENSLDVKMLSSYKLFTLNMHCELNQQTYISELLLISAHFLSLKPFFSRGLTHALNVRPYTCYCLTNNTVCVRHKTEVFKMCKNCHFLWESYETNKIQCNKSLYLNVTAGSICN